MRCSRPVIVQALRQRQPRGAARSWPCSRQSRLVGGALVRRAASAAMCRYYARRWVSPTGATGLRVQEMLKAGLPAHYSLASRASQAAPLRPRVARLRLANRLPASSDAARHGAGNAHRMSACKPWGSCCRTRRCTTLQLWRRCASLDHARCRNAGPCSRCWQCPRITATRPRTRQIVASRGT